MLAKNKAQETWREASVPLNENAPTTIYFRDTEPNHIVITNPTSNTIYVSTSSNVSQNNHEMQVPAGGTKMFAKPQGMRSIYVWHADNIIENIPIVSFYDEFNPQNIAQTQETVNTQNVTGTVDVATMPALPGGTNNIGSVNVAELPALPPGTANIGHVNVDALPAVDVNTLPAIPSGTNHIGSVSKIMQGSLTDHSGTITTAATAQQVAPANASRQYLLLQNVSTADLWFDFGVDAVQSNPSFKLAAGEKLTFTEFIPTDSLSVIGGTSAQAFTVKEG